MKKENQEPLSYTIEREFLAKITPAELMSRIIRTHLTADIKTTENGGRHL